jgi:lysophospholipase L1-like esterase
VLFLLILLVAGVVAAEGVLRAYLAVRGWTPNCYAAQLELLAPHPVNGYRLAPDFRLRSGTFIISTNSLGLRGPEIDPAQPAQGVRIAVFGGSAAFGYLVSDGQEASRLLETRLQREFPDVQVLNAGVPGYNLNHSFVLYEEVVAPLQPDLVVLYAGCNDIGYVVSREPDANRFQFAGAPPAWERRLGHSTLYGFVAYRLLGGSADFAIGNRVVELPTPQGLARFRQNLARFADRVAADGGQLVLCAEATAARADVAPDLRTCMGATEADIARTIAIFEALRSAMQSIAVERGLLYVDASAHVPPTREFLGDTIHLTPQGEELLANVLAKELRPLLLGETPVRTSPMP